MISMRTIFIHVRNLGAPFMRYHFINKWPYFEYPGIQPRSDFLYWLWLPHRWSHQWCDFWCSNIRTNHCYSVKPLTNF